MLQNKRVRERRVYERVLVRCPVRFKTDRENVLDEGSSKDISDAGLGLFTRSKLEPDTHLEMWIKFSPQIKQLHLGGKVVWAEKGRPGLWRAGVCFDQMALNKIVKILINKNLN